MRGFKNIIGNNWIKLQQSLLECAINLGFIYIDIPSIQSLNIFNSTGEDLNKEMFIFKYRDESVCLTPEQTAPILEYIKENKKQNLVYFSKCWRKERPQKGRYREFRQFGVEAFLKNGEKITLFLIKKIIDQLKLENVTLYINNIGTTKEREKYIEVLKNYFMNCHLSNISKSRIHTNVLRILDSKEPEDEIAKNNAPFIGDFLTVEQQNYTKEISDFCTQIQLKYEIKHSLVRGLEYYNGLVFELVNNENLTLIGGGSYMIDNVQAFGFGAGVERLYENIYKDENFSTNIPGLILLEPYYDVFNHIKDFYFLGYKATDGLREAFKLNLKKVILIGKEWIDGNIIIKNLDNGQQEIYNIK